MSFILWNIQGCLAHKKAKLHFIAELANDKSIVALNETFFNPTISDGEITYYFPKHNFVRTDRDTGQEGAKKKQGGTLLLYPNTFIKCDELRFSNGFVEVSGALLKVNENDTGVTFITAYMPPDTPLTKFKEAVEVVEAFMDACPHSKHHLSGDMNLSTDTVQYLKDEDDNLFPVILSGRDDMNTIQHQKRERAHTIFNMANQRGLIQIVDQATRGKNILDLIFTDTNGGGIDVIGANELSDHNVIINHTDLTAPPKADTAAEDSPEIRRLDTRKMDTSKAKTLLAKINWQHELSNMKAHEQKERLIQVLTEKMKEAGASASPPRRRGKPPKQLTALLNRKKRKNLNLKFLTEGAKREKVQAEVVKINAEIAKVRKRLKDEQEEKVIKEMKTNPRSFFAYAKRFKKKHNNVGPLRIDGKYVSEQNELANALQRYYMSAFSKPDEANEILDKEKFFYENNDDDALVDITVTTEDVEIAIKKLPAVSAGGSDGVSSTVIKTFKEELIEPLKIMFNKSIKDGEALEIPFSTVVVPLLKPGKPPDDPKSYRSISLCSIIIKTLERIVKDRITKHIQKNNLNDPHQWGFVEGRSSQVQLIQYWNFITSHVNDSTNVHAIYQDFSRAFDVCDFGILCSKMKQKFKISGNVLKFVDLFLTNRQQVVTVNGFKSRPETITSSVVAGSVMGPTLFGIYISDFPTPTHPTTIGRQMIAKFADDVKQAAIISMTDAHEHLRDVNNLHLAMKETYKWAERNNMIYNQTKFFFIDFKNSNYKNSRRIPKMPSATYLTPSGSVIPSVEAEKDLGVYIQSTMNWDVHIGNIVTKGWKTIHLCLRTFQNRNAQAMITLWTTIIRPVIMYNSALMGNLNQSQYQQLERLQKYFLRKIKWSKEGVLVPSNMEYRQLLEVFDMMSVQRYREWAMLKLLVNQIRTGQLHQIGLRIASENLRVGPRLELYSCHQPLNKCSQEDMILLHKNTQKFVEEQQNTMIYTIVFSILGSVLICLLYKYVVKYRKKMRENKILMQKIMEKLDA